MTEPRKAALGWLALFALAVAMRSLLYPFVFTGSGIDVPGGTDEFYHLRRIWYSVVNFPAVLDFDPYVNHPDGARPPWPPAFDWSVAAVARLLVGAERQARVEQAAACVPPILGALTVLAAAWVARRHFGRAEGWLTGLMLALLPAHVLNSGLAAIDHHVANGLMAVLLVGAAMSVAGPARGRRFEIAIAATGVVAAAMILLWLGALLEVLVVQLVLVAQALLSPERALARTRAFGLAAVHALAALVLAPFCVGQEWTDLGPVSPLVLSAFQPLWFGAGAGALGAVGLLWGWDALGASRARRIGSAIALGGAALTLATLAIPGIRAALGNAALWFSADPYMTNIWEIQPLLFESGRFAPQLANVGYSYLFWAYPIAAVWMAVAAVRERRAEWMLLVIWSAAFIGAALAQRRFNELASPGFPLVMGPALVHGWRAVASRVGAPRRRLAAAAAVGLVLLAFVPSLRELGHIGRSSLLLLQGASVADTESPYLRKRDVLKRLSFWLRERSPATRGYLDPALAPEYGILSAWDDGHLLRYYAERPLVQDNFGPYAGRTGFEAARAYFASPSEDEAVAIANRAGARYVVATVAGSGQFAAADEPMARRLTLQLRATGGLVLPNPPLDRHRLVFVAEDRERARAVRQPPEVAALYEIVKGANVVGDAAPHATVRFELPLTLPDGTATLRIARVEADAGGRYQIRLPYPTEATGAAVRPASSYRVSVGSGEAQLAITEADVILGREVAGPTFAR